MSYTAATWFDKDSWEKQGLNWVRKAKSAGVSGFIIGSDLPQEAHAKAKELGFTVVPLITKYGDERDKFHTVLENLKGGQRCLLTRPDATVKGGLPETKDLICNRAKASDPFGIVSPIRNLNDRAKALKLLRDAVEKVYGATLSSKSVLGTRDFWAGYTGFLNYLYEKNYLDRHANEELTLNLYVALAGSVSLEIAGND